MTDVEVAEWFKLIQGGGSVAAMAAVLLGMRLLSRLERLLQSIVDQQQMIMRGMVALAPGAEKIFQDTASQILAARSR